jgi:hypothetical protein
LHNIAPLLFLAEFRFTNRLNTPLPNFWQIDFNDIFFHFLEKNLFSTILHIKNDQAGIGVDKLSLARSTASGFTDVGL